MRESSSFFCLFALSTGCLVWYAVYMHGTVGIPFTSAFAVDCDPTVVEMVFNQVHTSYLSREDVVWFDVLVHDLLGVDFIQNEEELAEEHDTSRLVHWSVLEESIEIASVCILHNEVGVLDVLERGDGDVWMVYETQCLHLPLKESRCLVPTFLLRALMTTFFPENVLVQRDVLPNRPLPRTLSSL